MLTYNFAVSIKILNTLESFRNNRHIYMYLLYVFTGPKLPMHLNRHAMVQLGNGQVIIMVMEIGKTKSISLVVKTEAVPSINWIKCFHCPDKGLLPFPFRTHCQDALQEVRNSIKSIMLICN